MDKSDLERLLSQLSSETEWHVTQGLAGVSEALRRCTGELSNAKARIAECRSSEQRVVVCVRQGPRRLDEGLLSSFGLPSGSVVTLELCPDADAFNHGCLFGNGPEKGIFECEPARPIAIAGIEHLNNCALERIVSHIVAWRLGAERLTIFFGVPHPNLPKLREGLSRFVTPVVINVPSIHERRGDISYAIHEAAIMCGGGLDQFDHEAVEWMLSRSWQDDLREIDSVVRGIYHLRDQGTSVIRLNDVQNAVARYDARRRVVQPMSAGTREALWNQLQRLVAEANRDTTVLLGAPFFSLNTAPIQGDPLSSVWPELNFIRLVSWAYINFIEAAEPNLRCAMKLFHGVQMSPDRASHIREAIVCLRTFTQHHLQFSSTRDVLTIERACTWFERTIGQRQPAQEHFERSICCLLGELIELLRVITTFLGRVARDEFRDAILQQWRYLRETQWEKYRFEALLSDVLGDLGRTDLKAQVVTERLLPELQQRLLSCAEDADKVQVLRAFIESRISEDFPMQMPVTGGDIIGLGVPPSPIVSDILKKLRSHFDATNASREELLALARNLIGDRRGT